jgi:hypothetical protein
MNLQPTWRRNDSEAAFSLSRDNLVDETWQGLRKGGTSGIYVAIMAISWWVKNVGHDVNVWAVVDDLQWVIQQMKKDLPYQSVPLKRAREEDENEGHHSKL